jgi:hypothetical protein
MNILAYSSRRQRICDILRVRVLRLDDTYFKEGEGIDITTAPTIRCIAPTCIKQLANPNCNMFSEGRYLDHEIQCERLLLGHYRTRPAL